MTTIRPSKNPYPTCSKKTPFRPVEDYYDLDRFACDSHEEKSQFKAQLPFFFAKHKKKFAPTLLKIAAKNSPELKM